MTDFKIKDFPFGQRYVVEIGESGRGRSKTCLIVSNMEVNPDNDEVMNGATWDDFIFSRKSVGGKEKISSLLYKMGAKKLCYLDSYGGYSRRRDGTIKFLKWDNTPLNQSDTLDFAVWGNGADGDAGRIGQWDICLWEKGHYIMTCQTSGHYDDKCFIQFPGEDGKIYECDSWEDLKQLYNTVVEEF